MTIMNPAIAISKATAKQKTALSALFDNRIEKLTA